MSLENNIRLHVHHIASPYIYGTTADGQDLCAEIIAEAYLPDIEHLREGDTIMLIGTEHIQDSSPVRTSFSTTVSTTTLNALPRTAPPYAKPSQAMP